MIALWIEKLEDSAESGLVPDMSLGMHKHGNGVHTDAQGDDMTHSPPFFPGLKWCDFFS